MPDHFDPGDSVRTGEEQSTATARMVLSHDVGDDRQELVLSPESGALGRCLVTPGAL
ncbi:hypothetical protein [Streptomyces sp. NPDC055134]